MKKQNSQDGKTIIELLIVLLILAVISTFALSSFDKSKTAFTRQNFAREIKASLEQARADSIKRRAMDSTEMAQVTIDSATGFSLYADLNQNRTIEFSEIKQVRIADGSVKIVGENMVFPVTIKFDRRGFIKATNGAGTEISPQFTVCENCTQATANEKNSNVILISPTGAVFIMKGGDAAAASQNPVLSSVGSDAQINQLAVVNPSSN